MRLKQCIFALVAMLLCAFSANAQESVVAKIGNVEYTTFASAMADANAATSNVTVEVYGAVEFVNGMELDGSYTAITFTGMSTEAKITINQTAGGDYLTAHGKTVAFNDLILAKANPAWSGNSGHMGNYFSIQGGTVTYTNCTFPNGACTNTGTAVYNNCTFQNASEYGLWVYDDALVTVNGGTIDSKKGIKVYSEGEESVTSTLTVQNATFTENVTAKPAVAVGYAESITLIGNTYNNTTGHIELDSGSDADCEGITFVAQDSEGNDISSVLTVVDRSKSSAACGVLVDGKIYTTVTTAAAEATSGSTVTLLYSTTETVELPEGVTLNTNGFTANNVTVATSGVAQVGENVFTTVLEALQYAIDNNAAELKILCDVREKMTTDFDLIINADLTITADAPVKVEFYNDGTSYDFAVGSNNNNTLTIGENVHFDLVDRVIWLGYWGNNVTVVVNGYLGGYQIWHGANTVVKGTLDSHGEAFIMRRDATLTANEGAKVNANYFQIYSGHIVAENATITAGLVWVNNNHSYGNEGTVSFELDNTEFTSNGEVKIYAGEGKIVSVTLENSSLFDAKGVVTLGDNVKVVADATSSIQDANGSVVIPVAKIGDVEYTSLQAALDAAAAGTGNVTVTILADVNLTGIDWNPVTVSEPGYPLVTVEGGDHTITGLNDMLFHSTWAGKSGLIIKDLTIANSAIVNDKDDAAGTVGVGAFIGYPQASATITLENCHLENSSVEGGHWTGGLIGMAGGYNGEDGPVFMNLTIEGCSVTGSTITGKGSVGGVIGHGSCAAWTNVVIKETTVENNTITSTGSSNVKAGAVMGTIGAAGQPTTANGETKTGGASVSATVADNTVTSNGTEITTIYGRQGTPTGQLYVAGGSYDNYPIEQGVAYAAPVEGYVIVENADGTYGLEENVELPEVEITDIKGSLTDSDPDLTFALNFTIKDLENLDEEYLNKVMEQYGSWYTDYVLTISGLTDENVTFNANGDSDGYLAGQYDGFGPNWVSVPFENVTLANNESIYIMEYAAKLMGQSGLRYTLAEIVSIVMDFDCGVYFTPEFLTANPGLKVDLHLKVFTEDAEGNKVNDINVATNNFDVEDYVAIVHATGKQTTYCTTLADAVAAAEADEKITLIADVELTETLNIPAGKEVVLDLNGKTISQTKEQTAGYQMILNDGKLTINDSSEAKTGKISYTDSGNGGEYISDVIYNRSVLVINGGTIENLSSATVASNGYPHAVDTYSGIRDTYVEINGGTIYCAEYSAIRMFCVSATNKADLVINGGTIKGAIDMQNGTKNLALGTLTINDGTFETTKNANNIRFANWNGGATEYGISAAIKGGSFNGGITTAYVPAAANWDKGVITGGTFAKDMTEYCAEGFVCEANIDGTYGIVADPSYIAELTIDDANPVDYTSDLEGKTVGKLTYKRSLIGGIWNPFFVPFEIDIERLVNEFGLEVAYYNQMISTENADGGFDYKMEVKHLTSGVISHYPLFVKVATDTEIEYVAEDVVLGSADEFVITTSSVTNTFKLYGTHQAKSVSDLEGKYAINALNGQWTPSTSGIKPHRLYFEIQENNNNPFSSSPAKSIGIVVRGEEGFTGIEEVTGEANENVIFDLQGRRILEPQKGELYIINGKKVIY